ncbi:MAG: hypothetical protein FWF10_10805 [Clostridiales bacterium]|nr:hypothetical protein [Clostridiales bacterium]
MEVYQERFSDQPVGMLNWAISLFFSFVPGLGLLVCLLLSFSSHSACKRNYFRTMLFAQIVVSCVLLVLIFFFSNIVQGWADTFALYLHEVL